VLRNPSRRWLSLVYVVFAGCAGDAPPAVDIAAEESAVRARSEAVAAAENAKQFTEAVTFFTDDASVHMANAPVVQGNAAIRKLYDDFAAMGFDGLVATITDIKVAASGDDPHSASI